MSMRKSSMAFVLLAAGAGLLALEAVHGLWRARADGPVREQTAKLAGVLGLTDIALFTEARYARHPSMADLHTAFQDHPVSLDHFPTGSLVAPPRDFGPTGGFAAPGVTGDERK